MNAQLTKGNEAIVKAAVLAGARAFYGYPITPASEIAEAAALYFPQAGGVFVQAESEVAAINMVYGAAAAGRAHDRVERPGHQPDAGRLQLPGGRGAALRDRRHHARRSGTGQHRAGAERLQPDCEGRRPRQLPSLVLAPDSVQEMADLTTLAFDLAERVSQSGGGAGGWFHRTDDGAGSLRRPGGAGARSVGRDGDEGGAAQPGDLHLTWSRT